MKTATPDNINPQTNTQLPINELEVSSRPYLHSESASRWWLLLILVIGLLIACILLLTGQSNFDYFFPDLQEYEYNSIFRGFSDFRGYFYVAEEYIDDTGSDFTVSQAMRLQSSKDVATVLLYTLKPGSGKSTMMDLEVLKETHAAE